MKDLKSFESRRIVIFIDTDEEKKIARELYQNSPDLFIWAEDESLAIELIDTINDNITKILFLRRGVNYTTSEKGNDLEILR